MAHGREAPDGHDDHVADARADLVNEASRYQQANCIGDHKEGSDVAVSHFCHPDAVFTDRFHKSGLEYGKDRTVHIVDGSGGEKHGADSPAHVPDPCAEGRQVFVLRGQIRFCSHLWLLIICMLFLPARWLGRALLRMLRLLPGGVR